MTIRIFLLAFLLSSPTVPWANSFKTKTWQTNQGVRVVFYQAMEVPILDISLAFHAGSAKDGEQFGLSALTARLLNQGNGGFNAAMVAEKLDKTGAQLAIQTDQDKLVLNLRTLTKPDMLTPAIDTLRLIINHPDFPEEAFHREQNQQLMAIKQADESPNAIASHAFLQALYQTHPYGHPVNGNQRTVKALTREQVQQFYHRYFVAKNAVLVLVGAIDEPMAHQLAEQITHELPRGQRAPATPNAPNLVNELNVEQVVPSSQTIVLLGQLGITPNNKHYFPLLIGNYTLGGGLLVSRLSHEIREKRGLTYGVSSQFVPLAGTGPFIINLSTKNNQAIEAANQTRETLLRFLNEGPTESELAAAKQYLSGSFPLSLGSNRSIVSNLMQLAFYELPDTFLDTYVDQIKAVTITDIKQAFQQVIDPNHLLQVSVGKS